MAPRRDLPPIHSTDDHIIHTWWRSNRCWFGWRRDRRRAQQLEMRDGDKSKLRDKGILKAMLNIIDVIAHKLLGMNDWEQAKIDRTMVETLDGTKNERCWSRANSDDSLSCRRFGERSVSLHVHLVTHRQAHRQVCDARTFFQRDQWWKSCWEVLGVSFLILPTEVINARAVRRLAESHRKRCAVVF